MSTRSGTLAPSRRRQQVVMWLAQNQFASIAELASRFSVSEMTIRRDLTALEKKGLVERVAGGGEIAHGVEETSFEMKRDLFAPEKSAIANAALKWIQSEMTVAFSAGTTTWNIARIVRGFSNLTFVTNSTNVALTLQQGGWEHIILSGGHFRTPSDALVGPIAEQSMRELYSDVLFLGVEAVDWEGGGLSCPNVAEAAVDRALIDNTEKVVVVVDHSKLGRRALCRIAPLSMVDMIITDEGIKSEDVLKAHQHGIHLDVVVPVNSI